MRVNDLAKELGKTNKEILEILQNNQVDVKSHMSNISDDQIAMVKKSVGGGAKPAEGEAPKKKIAAVFRPQNSQQMRSPRPARPQENAAQQSQQPQSREGSREQREGSPVRAQGTAGREGGFNRDNRDGNRPQGGFNRDNRDGNRPQGGRRDGGARPSSSFDTPIQAKPQSTRQNKNNYKNDKFDKRDREEDMPIKGTKVSKHPFQMPQKPAETKVEETIKSIVIPEILTIKELAEKMKLQPSAIVKKLFLQGKIVTLNQEIDYEQAEEIALEYDVLCEKEVKVDVIEELLKEEEESEDTMTSRPPVVCVMGHVDHGKTSLLDAIRATNVTAREAGGITQHIGAYVVEINGQEITFLDTPGHEAFTAMRMRGAQATDIAILVVAADDGVMPQTVEAINHAKAAGVEIIVAVNKIDKPSANVDRVKQELSEYELIPEDWGGSTIFVPVSAHTKEGITELLEMILLTAEVKELKANANRKARGLVIEAELDKGKGPVATILVQKGTLHVGENIAVGSCYGKVRAMMDDKGRRVKEAGPSTPVEILGLNDVPGAGEIFMAMDSDKEARHFAETFISEGKNKLLEETKSKLSLDDLFTQIQAGNVKELPIIVKADVQGSVEAVKQSLTKLSNEEVMVKVIHGGVGAINESDVSLASASNAIIIGFNVRPDVTAKSIAEREKVDVRLYRVIYQAIEDVEAAMKGMLDPVFEEKVIGHAVVRQTFKASGVGTIAGAYIMDGKFQRGCSCRITRDGEQIFEGALASLKRFKDDVKEVNTGYECGLVFEKFNDIQEDDMVEAYTMVEVPR
ncbi:MAG: translation initiation factor IF-2 [Lachnoclostridium edouardi]|uniref:translation initiation factor IF-2 n=1 Tax=Lachnoclostridium edouardi TaxID=1926283 RepID=UPI0026DD0BEA|nr:translation initiation factor IF-2 [Lachnoclostridium edouardi]MDO4278834.1 translation initiation factor IF-2 [Lachnoclostridium edouardi]